MSVSWLQRSWLWLVLLPSAMPVSRVYLEVSVEVPSGSLSSLMGFEVRCAVGFVPCPLALATVSLQKGHGGYQWVTAGREIDVYKYSSAFLQWTPSKWVEVIALGLVLLKRFQSSASQQGLFLSSGLY